MPENASGPELTCRAWKKEERAGLAHLLKTVETTSWRLHHKDHTMKTTLWRPHHEDKDHTMKITGWRSHHGDHTMETMPQRPHHRDYTMETAAPYRCVCLCVWGVSGEYSTGSSQCARTREQVSSSFLSLIVRGQGPTRVTMAHVLLKCQGLLVCNQITCACLLQPVRTGPMVCWYFLREEGAGRITGLSLKYPATLLSLRNKPRNSITIS